MVKKENWLLQEICATSLFKGLFTIEMFLAIKNNEATEQDFAHLKKLIPINWRNKIQNKNERVTENEIRIRAFTTK